MIRLAKVLPAIALSFAFALALIAGCGGGDDESTPTPGVTGTPATTPSPAQTPAATTPAGTPAATAPGQVTLEITSVEPSPAGVGDTVTITFQTQPKNVIGLQVTNPGGQIVTQTQLTADANGVALLDQKVELAGSWLVEAAAGRTIADLLALQINPRPGPHSDDATFEVQ